MLRKDFIVTDYQLLEARAAGADLVLLIVAALDDDELRRLHDEARELGLTVLVEVHDEAETERAVDARRRADRRQRPQPEDPRGRRRHVRPAGPADPRRPGARSPSPASPAPPTCAGSSARARASSSSARRWSRTATPRPRSGAMTGVTRASRATGCDADERGWFGDFGLGGVHARGAGRRPRRAHRRLAGRDGRPRRSSPSSTRSCASTPALPSPLYDAERLSEQVGARILLKREDLNHTGAHKIRNVLGQALLTRRMGKTRVIAETGAGQHGVASATAAAYFGLDCTVYMGAVDTRRQALNVARMHLLGAKVVPVDSGSATLKDAINEALRDWVATRRPHGVPLRHGRRPAPVPEHGPRLHPRHRRRGPRSSASSSTACCPTRSRPASAAAPTRSGCSPRSSTTRTSRSTASRPAATGSRPAGTPRPSWPARAACCTAPAPSSSRTRTARPSSPTRSRPASTTPASGPQHAHLAATGRATYLPVTDAEAMDALALLSRTEGIIPAIESAHAVAGALDVAAKLAAEQGPRRHHADQPQRPRRQGHGHRHRVVRPRRPRRGPRSRSATRHRPASRGRRA